MNSNYWKAHYKAKKQALVVALGGKCVDCGSTYKLDKTRNVTSLIRGPKGILEAAKCVLRCHAHHMLKTHGADEHGTYRMFRYRGCRCQECRDVYNANQRVWKNKRRAYARMAKSEVCKTSI